VVVPATAALAAWLGFSALVFFTGFLAGGLFTKTSTAVKLEDLGLLAGFGAILWWRTARSGVRTGTDRVKVRNVWRSHHLYWEEVAGFEVAPRRAFGAGVRLVTTEHKALWCFGLQSRSKVLRPELYEAVDALNQATRRARRRLKLKKAKAAPMSVGELVSTKGLPRYRSRVNLLYWPLPVVGLFAVACSSVWEVVVPLGAWALARYFTERPGAALAEAALGTAQLAGSGR
jgi:hypothetical protein